VQETSVKAGGKRSRLSSKLLNLVATSEGSGNQQILTHFRDVMINGSRITNQTNRNKIKIYHRYKMLLRSTFPSLVFVRVWSFLMQHMS
jgi:hypothetical protein